MLLWVGAATLQLLPGQNTGPDLASLLTAGTDGAPHWLAQLDTTIADWVSQNGTLAIVALTATELLIGGAALRRKTRSAALAAGLAGSPHAVREQSVFR
jgi:hypothetical protein